MRAFNPKQFVSKISGILGKKGPRRSFSSFIDRHIGTSNGTDEVTLLKTVGCSSETDFIAKVIPAPILESKPTDSPEPSAQGMEEHDLLALAKNIASKNKIFKSFIGMGYYGNFTPTVILRNVLENPAWYTQYTPYQPEISQGRLESLLNYQTMIVELTGLPVANASLLDEGTAAAEAMNVFFGSRKSDTQNVFLVDKYCHPQTISCVKCRADPLEIKVKIVDDWSKVAVENAFGALYQYPNTLGAIDEAGMKACKEKGVPVACATDLLALVLLKPPGELGFDIALGNSQRFGVPFGFGGPHAAFFSCSEKYKRKIPGRLIGVSKDADGKPAMRLTLQTREQHIRRDKATSNICTAQALLANMAAMYAIYHGPKGLKRIAKQVNAKAILLAEELRALGGLTLVSDYYFDTIVVDLGDKSAVTAVQKLATKSKINFRYFGVDDSRIGISVDESTKVADIAEILSVFRTWRARAYHEPEAILAAKFADLSGRDTCGSIPKVFARTSAILTHPIFNCHHSEMEMTRYLHKLQDKDLSLVHAMIPLGSCTMKLNATTEMIPVTWPEFGLIHPFSPKDQAEGYYEIISDLESDLAKITGFDAISMQPNSGAQGEYAGLRVITAYQKATGQGHRKHCLIPVSAHGTNPASAVMAGLKVVPVNCDEEGNLDLEDLKAKAIKYKDTLSCSMITYPSTFGVFEPTVLEACKIIHDCGGQVYMDGANMNAQVGFCKPGELGFDVCHLNLHKTFCIPHGGGGPGMGPIGVKKHLAPFLPSHPVVPDCNKDSRAIEPISAAPYGSASILLISWAYIKMMGATGLKKATYHALLNANYLAFRLADHYPILYTNEKGFVAHEFIIDVRPFEKSAGIQAIDVAKRLQDYGFHPPTMSWPVPNTLMIEPTESESKKELDRFIDAMISIRKEIAMVEKGQLPRDNNMLVNAPHSLSCLVGNSDKWDRPYSIKVAGYPVASLLTHGKFWPSVGRLDDVYGDRNIVCTCPPMESYQQE